MEKPMIDLHTLIANQENAVRMQRFNKLSNPKATPILLAGGVGDAIMTIPFVEAIAELGPVEVYTTHVSTFDYFKPESLHKGRPVPVPCYTWILEVNAVARFRLLEGFMGFDNPAIYDLWTAQQEHLDKNSKFKTLCHNHPFQDTTLAIHARDLNLNRRQLPFFSVGMADRPRVSLPRAKPENYITIHDGYEAESAFIVPGRSTKTWKWSHWNELVRNLKKSYPNHKIVQLGTTTGRPIDGVDECLLNKTTITQAFDILKFSSLHIDGDSGLVHAATAMNVPCVVMFGPTPDYFYGYKENINLRSNVCGEACYWLTRDWLGKCPIGYPDPKCMDEITPDQVMVGVNKVMTQ